MRWPRPDKIAFVLSLALFAFVYGIATEAFGWFPSDLLRRAWNQVEAVSPVSTSMLTGDRPEEPRWRTSRVYDRHGVRIERPDRIQPGLTLLVSAWESPEGRAPGLRLIDREGRVVHRWRVDPAEVFPDSVSGPKPEMAWHDVQGAHLFPDGDVLVNVAYVGAARLDACGRVLWARSRNNYHHSVARADDGSFWIPGVRRNVPAESPSYPGGYPGLEGPIHQDLLVRLTGRGEVLTTINVLDLLYDHGLERHIPKAMVDRFDDDPYGKDVVHLNDIEPLSASMADEYPLFEAGDLLVSLRKPNLVLVADPETKTVKWHASGPFIHQHDPDFIGGGWIGVFDNNHDGTARGTMLGGSRIVALRPAGDSSRVLFPTPRSEPFYTPIRGVWQHLRNGNLLLTESQAGRVVEVGPDGRTVWEWIHEPSGPSTVPSVTKGARVDVPRRRVESWPCSPSEARASAQEARP